MLSHTLSHLREEISMVKWEEFSFVFRLPWISIPPLPLTAHEIWKYYLLCSFDMKMINHICDYLVCSLFYLLLRGHNACSISVIEEL